ncbi:taste receptor type 2 member 9-like [Lissotriton helveticus]
MEDSFMINVLNITLNLIGILANAFIVVFLLLAWAQGRRLNTCDLILVSLGFGSIFYQCSSVCFRLLGFQVIYVNPQFVFFIDVYSSSTTSWFTACLCIFYCVKIVDFNHHLFFWLKIRISKMVPWMLMGSVMGSIALGIPSYLSSYEESLENSTAILISNVTINNNALNMAKSYQYARVALGICLPLVLDIASMQLILISLCRHTRRMNNNASGFSQPQLQTHYRAAKMMGFLLLTNISLLISQILTMCTTNVLMVSICWVIIFAFLTTQPIVLILGNPKLRKEVLHLLG